MKKNVLFRPWTSKEDLVFCNDADAKGLGVLKFNLFEICKVNINYQCHKNTKNDVAKCPFHKSMYFCTYEFFGRNCTWTISTETKQTIILVIYNLLPLRNMPKRQTTTKKKRVKPVRDRVLEKKKAKTEKMQQHSINTF